MTDLTKMTSEELEAHREQVWATQRTAMDEVLAIRNEQTRRKDAELETLRKQVGRMA